MCGRGVTCSTAARAATVIDEDGLLGLVLAADERLEAAFGTPLSPDLRAIALVEDILGERALAGAGRADQATNSPRPG